MGQMPRLRAVDGHELDAYLAAPAGESKGGVVVLQEIFGVNQHIRSVCDKLAAEGWTAVAPALFDRFQRGFESGYSPEEIQTALGYARTLNWDALILDGRAAVDHLHAEAGSASILGFCLGGSMAFDMATRFGDIRAAVGYYGGRIASFADARPLCPVLLHYGDNDHSIPLSIIEEVRAKRPDVDIRIYPAGHGFNRAADSTPEGEQARIAWQRTMAFLERAR